MLKETLGTPAYLGAILTGTILLHQIIYAIAVVWTKRSPWGIDDSIVKRSRNPMGLIMFLVALKFLESSLGLQAEHLALFDKSFSLLWIFSLAWLITSLTLVIQDIVNERFNLQSADNLEARKMHTQIRMIRKLVVVTTTLIAGSLMLMTFPSARTLGASLLTSAGIAGLAVAMAARPVLANLLAGIQIALSQPIRLDDVVIVEGEWGKIEEITTTYVVVKIWDSRRLILPLSYFLEKPFQNWTRTSADILGTVIFYTDYKVPMDALRQALETVVKQSDLWDGRVCGLQATDASEKTMQWRALISAADASKAWDLRCLVREKILAWLQKEHPLSLPRLRVENETKIS